MFRRKRTQVNQFLLLCPHYLQNRKVNWEFYEYKNALCLVDALELFKMLGSCDTYEALSQLDVILQT